MILFAEPLEKIAFWFVLWIITNYTGNYRMSLSLTVKLFSLTTLFLSLERQNSLS